MVTLIGRIVALLALRNAWRARHDAPDFAGYLADVVTDRFAASAHFIRFGHVADVNLYRGDDGIYRRPDGVPVLSRRPPVVTGFTRVLP